MTLASIVPARDRCFPVDEAVSAMLPDAGLVRGRVVGCTGPAAMSLSLALAARAAATGSWLAVVGVPMLGVEAVTEFGVPLSRLVSIHADGRPSEWAERVGAAADGFDLILTRPPAGAERVVRKVRQRMQARGVVLFAVGPTSPGVSCDVEFTTSAVEWVGLGQGHGSLMGRRTLVRVGGRRVPRPVERELWLPGPGGGVEVVGDLHDDAGRADEHIDTPERQIELLDRAG
ncbi:hypothetical protein [Ilumatobacter sp.]|uniref:hypothetical protein n=1 Tax=Ilumatobacter sp. TaxID=1967498 RepID=UPI003AF4C271